MKQDGNFAKKMSRPKGRILLIKAFNILASKLEVL